jgi:hypothetical protein
MKCVCVGRMGGGSMKPDQFIQRRQIEGGNGIHITCVPPVCQHNRIRQQFGGRGGGPGAIHDVSSFQ